MISDPLLLALNVFTSAVILLTVHLLVLRSTKYQAYLPLAWCLTCVGFIIAKPIMSAFLPQAQLYWLVLSLPALLLIAPSFWLYVKGITHEFPWRFKQVDLKHGYLAILGLLIALFGMLLPDGILHSIVTDDGNSKVLLQQHPLVLSYWIDFSLIVAFVLILTFVLQSGYYCLLIFRRLNRYNHHLKDLFASTEDREMRWLSTLLITVGGVWLLTAVNIFLANVFHVDLIGDTLIAITILVMVWSVSIWGLRQKPGFEEVYESVNNTESSGAVVDKIIAKKYERSALDEEQSQLIAKTIVDVMENDQLYLDNELSLQKLSKHINTPANYISQTLNSTIGMNFFDFVNRYRIEQAKQRLTGSSMSVIDIAFDVGFNAKSSFYKAFKKVTSVTPSEFRKQRRLNKN